MKLFPFKLFGISFDVITSTFEKDFSELMIRNYESLIIYLIRKPNKLFEFTEFSKENFSV